MADEKPAPPGSPWEVALIIILIVIASIALMWQQGRLKEINTKDLLVPPPISSKTATTTYQQATTTFETKQYQPYTDTQTQDSGATTNQ